MQDATTLKRDGFSYLIYDERFRSIFVQIAVVVGVVFLFGWMTSNAIENLRILGISQGFGFLDRTSFYDINQTLIPYSSESTHGRAALVGLLNTLVVAFVGIIFATVLGFVIGIARLSHNWLIAKLAAVYVETIRNVPVLIQIVLWQTVLLSLPGVKNSIGFLDTFFLSNRGVVMPSPVLGEGFWLVTLIAILGIVSAIVYTRRAVAQERNTGKQVSVLWVNLLLVVVAPLAVFLLMGAPLAFDVPELSKFNFKGGMTVRTEFVSLCTALSVYTSSFIAENVRGGILAVSKGQSEAASALGLSRGQTIWLVVVPQAMRVVIPPLTSQYLNLTKNSSLAIAVGYIDITATLGGTTLNQTGQAIECMFLLLLFYLMISVTVSLLMNWFNAKMSLVNR